MEEKQNFREFENRELTERDRVLEEVKLDGKLLRNTSEEFRNDRVIVLAAQKQTYSAGKKSALSYAGDKLKNDRTFFREAMKYGGSLFYASEELKNDKEFVLDIMKINNTTFQSCGEEVKNDKEVVLEYLKRNGELSYVGKEMKNDKEVVLTAYKNNDSAMHWVGKHLIAEAMKQKGHLQDDLPLPSNRRHHDNYEYLASIIIDYIPKQSTIPSNTANPIMDLKNDKEYFLELVNQNGLLLERASENLKNDREVVTLACRNNRGAFQFIGEQLIKSSNLLQMVKKNGGDVETALDNHEREKMISRNSNDDWVDELIQILRSSEWNGNITNFGKMFDMNRHYESRIRVKLKEKRFKDLEILRYLGRGAFGRTYLCRVLEIDGIFVVKIYNDYSMGLEKVEEAISRDSLMIPYHKNVASILGHSVNERIELSKLSKVDSYFTMNQKSFFGGMVLMRYYRTCLFSFLQSIPKHGCLDWKTAALIMVGIIEGASHLHENMIVHRDLHPGNIFIDPASGGIWIGDFGCSLDLRKNFDSDGKPSFIVSKNDEKMFNFSFCSYFQRGLKGFESENGFNKGGFNGGIPPEIKRFDPEADDFLDYEMYDIYSIGVLGMELLKIMEISEKSEELGSVFEKLKKDRKERPGFKEVLTEIVEIFFSYERTDDYIDEFGDFF